MSRIQQAARVFLVSLSSETRDRKSTRLNSSHDQISYAVFCLKKKNNEYGGVCRAYCNLMPLHFPRCLSRGGRPLSGASSAPRSLRAVVGSTLLPRVAHAPQCH